ncbi:MAG: CDP-diacylglycerol--glycerol-3-phosphate 3-phosphatidyltransferase [Clostridia bacterium]|nr:CDP-diacylglycerol--glycerol-3-phosphate 3-phosphatidyltransferase [Clostridia bacterium]
MKFKMNVPNALTMVRIFCTPIMVLLFLLPIPNGVGKFVALGIYILACFTDLLDGKIARKYNLITDFGKFMDQIADKFITTTAMILVLFEGIVWKWLAVLMLLIVVLRDILISGIRMVAANKNFVIAADIYGKIKSLFLDVASMVLMLYVGLSVVCTCEGIEYVKYAGLALMIVGVALSVMSCVNYSVKAVKGLTESQKVVEESPVEEDDE